MKIVIALGNPKDPGGPTRYAQCLECEFNGRGHDARLIAYPFWLWRFPSGLRHLGYAARLLIPVWRSDVVIAFDTMTVGAPAALVSLIVRRPLMIRIGGDFVWEQYVERTGDLIKLSRFYDEALGRLSYKEKLEISITRWVARRTRALVFNCSWLKDIWFGPYQLDASRVYVAENLYPARQSAIAPTEKNFVAAGRPIKLKQEKMLQQVVATLKGRGRTEIILDVSGLPPHEHQERVRRCYAVVLASVSDVSPNAIIDAVVHGKPFICTTDTGIRERLEGTGVFVDTSDGRELGEAIERLLDPAEYARIQARVEEFSFTRTWSDVAEDFLRIAHTSCVS